jgi:hypothetical protein
VQPLRQRRERENAPWPMEIAERPHRHDVPRHGELPVPGCQRASA